MAVPTGSGTETLHSHWFYDVDGAQTLIFGAQHHIYTVTNIIVCCTALNSSTDYAYINFKGHDSHSGTSGSISRLLRVNIPVGETFAWNERFSFYGYEPQNANALSVTQQIAIAAQAGSVAQELRFDCSDPGDSFHIMVSYIDQDWS